MVSNVSIIKFIAVKEKMEAENIFFSVLPLIFSELNLPRFFLFQSLVTLLAIIIIFLGFSAWQLI